MNQLYSNPGLEYGDSNTGSFEADDKVTRVCYDPLTTTQIQDVQKKNQICIF